MKYRILCVGRRAQDPLLLAAQVYIDRLDRYIKTTVQRLRESEPAKEANAILAALSPADHVVVLDEQGSMMRTMDCVHWVRQWQQAGRSEVTFIIGGADGLDARVKARAQQSLALSRLTLPHRLALVVLAEQLYRVHTVLRGEQYHRA